MSCGISFLSNNLVDGSNFELTTGSENSQFPLTNLNNDSPSYKFRSQENSVVIRFDLQQTRTIDTVALHGDTNSALGMTTASVKFSLTTDFSSSIAQNIPLSAEYIMGYEYVEEIDARFVELTLTGTGSFCELSNIFIGERLNLMQQNISISSFSYGYTDNSVVVSNVYGQRFIDTVNKLKELGGNLEFCIKSEQDDLDNLFLRHGKTNPLWVIIDKDGNSMIDAEYKLTMYGYLKDMPTWKASGGQTYNTVIKMVQAG